MPDTVERLLAWDGRAIFPVGADDLVELKAEIERLRKIETAARALKFSAYPAHGSGFVIQVSGGNINDLEHALDAQSE
jgi:hypothetical protein